ncbi:MAG: type II toxin-antitoxin system RelE/ParE family toxin [Methylococcales bacterium]|nr:type II toxin-antitoxin system RelE/ParE family toxin [Methylococcales bacterium]
MPKQIIDHVSDQATWDDIMYELYVKQKIENGLKAIDKGRFLSSEDAKRRLLGNERLIGQELALEDLEAIQVYIAKDSKFYARQFIERIFDAAKKPETFPEIGRRVPEAEERIDVRELIFQGYHIIYFIQPESISIIAVIHGRQDLAGMGDKPWLVD